jgi:hypothetical protein
MNTVASWKKVIGALVARAPRPLKRYRTRLTRRPIARQALPLEPWLGGSMRATLGLTVGALALLLAGCGGGPPAKYYYYPAWGFSVALNAPPKVTETPAGADGSPHNLTLIEDAGADDFAVYVADVGQPNKNIDQIADIAAPAVAKAIGAEVGPTTYVATVQTQNQAMGREISLTKAGHPFAKLRVYLVGNRFYQLAGRTTFGPDDAATKAFLDSFTILSSAPGVTNTPAAANAN